MQKIIINNINLEIIAKKQWLQQNFRIPNQNENNFTNEFFHIAVKILTKRIFEKHCIIVIFILSIYKNKILKYFYYLYFQVIFC